MDKIDEMGLLPDERKVMDKLMESYEAFLALPIQHPNEKGEFAFAVHWIQGLLSTRVARHCYPEGWPKKEANG